MYNNPLVSINCITYNHELFIRDALEGFLMQKTDFEFEILIHDDASTDNTANIIREYEAKYPDLIKPIYQTENQYSKGNNPNRVYQFPRAKGKYIAMCEGDDYWTDPLKLQKQVDFLETNEEFSACVHQYDFLVNNELIKSHSLLEQNLTVQNILNVHVPFQTASVVFRRKLIENIKFPKVLSGDLFLFVLFTLNGKLKFFPESMSIYRKHSSGISISVSEKKLKSDFNMVKVFNKMSPTFPRNAFKAYIYYTILAYPADLNIYNLFKNFILFKFYFYKSEFDNSSLDQDVKNTLSYKLPRNMRRFFRKLGLI